MNMSRLALAGLAMAALAPRAPAQVPLPDARPVPRVQVIPLPHHEASFQVDDEERTRYHFGPDLERPFLFPVVGPAGRSLTRMGHPRDPFGHSHHNSAWIAHEDAGGVSTWRDRGERVGRIVHRRLVRLDDGDEAATLVAENAWVDADGTPFLVERRGVTVRPLGEDEWLLILDLRLEPASGPVTLGKTPFGPIGVRMAKTIGTSDGGGLIRNSGGKTGEQGENGVFWKPARWVDYSGPIAPGTAGGITLMDHPDNPGHPVAFHVRADGWMGASLNLNGPITIEPGRPLRLRYGLFVHAGVPEAGDLDRHWKAFAALPAIDLGSD